MKAYKTFVAVFVGIFALVAAGFAVVLVALVLNDPFQLFIKNPKHKFFMDMRMQAAGIIRHYGPFDGVIIGTSMLENTDPKLAGKKLGGRWINISLRGGKFDERAIVLKYLFKHFTPKKIIYSFDIELYYSGAMEDKNYPKFDFLYDGNRFNDLRLYLNKKFIKCAFGDKNKECYGTETDMYKTTLLYRFPSHQVRFGGFENWMKHNNNHKVVIAAIKYLANLSKLPKFYAKPFVFDAKAKAALAYWKRNILDLASAHPQTEFELIIPTYSKLYYYTQSKEVNGRIAGLLREFVKASEGYANVRIYGFDDTPYASNIANYMDTVHYNKDLNDAQLGAIATHTHIVNAKNIDTYITAWHRLAAEYDLQPLINRAKRK